MERLRGGRKSGNSVNSVASTSRERTDRNTSPCPSETDSTSTLEDDDGDPTFEFADSSMDGIIESSSHSSSDSEHDSIIQKMQSSSTSSTGTILNNPQNNSQSQLPKYSKNEGTDSPVAGDQIQPDSEIDPVQHPQMVESLQGPKLRGRGYKKKKTFCRFCPQDVTNFERHLKRNHRDVKQVREMLSYPKKSKERRNLIKLLRNEGHFEEFLRGRTRPLHQKENDSNGPIVACPYCKGLYSKRYLCRHFKHCPAAKIVEDSKRMSHLSASQTLIACALDTSNTIHKMRVKEEVFDRMRADKVSMVAKTDILITHFGERYLKKHKRKQMASVCSYQMRELAKVVIMFREIENNDELGLIDAIEPSMFDKVVECAKKVGGYDPIKKEYRAASVSAHLGTSLKQASEKLISLIQQQKIEIKGKDPEVKLKAAKRFRDLVASEWTTEVSSLAFKDLNEKKWSKPTILPLTQDVRKFKDHVTQTANEAVTSLRTNPHDKQAYKNLVNATLTLTILYNRRRIGDVQYTKFDTYRQNFSSSNQEELINSLSSSEKLLTKYYKRVVTGGKGSRAIVILFPQNLQDLMKVMIDIRLKTNLVPLSNEYLFAYPGSDRWVRGDVVIRKFAQQCGLEHPDHISSNKLRKQISTVMQILNLNADEADQFATFMGHTGKTHDEFYKLPQDVYQTAKVSKLLILMDQGKGHQYKGKSLNEIEINPEIDVAESEDSDNDEPLGMDPEVSMSHVMPKSPEKSTPSTAFSGKPKQKGRSTWTVDQINVVKKHFKHHIQSKKAPKKQECENLMKTHPDLFKDKDWVRVKTYVYNSYREK